MHRLIVLLAVMLHFTFAPASVWQPTLKTDVSENWMAAEQKEILLSRNHIDVSNAKPNSPSEVKSYIEKQELVRSWIHRLMGISNFKVSKHAWDDKTSTLTFSGEYKNGADVHNFREEHVFSKKLMTKQISWPKKVNVDAKLIDKLWSAAPEAKL